MAPDPLGMPGEADMTMKDSQKKSYSTKGSKIAVALSALSFVIYLINMVAGKANIIYELNLFQIGPIAEFLILLFSSTTFIAAALLQEAAWKSTNEPHTQ
jgi:hypothetical protein